MMSDEVSDWAALARLTGVAFDAAQSRVAVLRKRETALRSTIAALEADRKAVTGSPNLDDPAHKAGASVLWQAWVDRRRAALNGELARTLVQIESARAALVSAHGRQQVTETLARDARNAARDLRERRSER